MASLSKRLSTQSGPNDGDSIHKYIETTQKLEPNANSTRWCWGSESKMNMPDGRWRKPSSETILLFVPGVVILLSSSPFRPSNCRQWQFILSRSLDKGSQSQGWHDLDGWTHCELKEQLCNETALPKRTEAFLGWKFPWRIEASTWLTWLTQVLAKSFSLLHLTSLTSYYILLLPTQPFVLLAANQE